ncbi:MAG: FecR domain-containing protein [Aquabacterium sp.]|jgi:transmembrane sensor|uniref:FecR domain-containing protein n=1 Tax=Aquabacterium sp. TaxID=1872578 RepID=UPI003BAF23AB
MPGASKPTGATVLEQASHWYALLQADEVSEADRTGWQRWLAADASHARAWARVEAMSQRFDALPVMTDRPAAVRALHRAQGAGRRRALKVMGAAGVGALGGWLVARDEGLHPLRADLRTGVGGQRTLVLADGSRVWLNSASALRVAFGARERHLELLKGELLIDTAYDANRPLVVSTEEGRMHALGTRFGVYREGGRCHVSVFQGAVDVRARHADHRFVVPAGQHVSLTGHEMHAPEAATPMREAWTRGLLVADDIRLGDFVDELARYQVGHLACSPAVAGLRLVGVFPLNNIEQIYAALEQALPVKVTRRLPWWRQVDAA